MLRQLLNHIQRHSLCKITDKILLAVSGGIDSMVMVHLFRQAGFNLAVAHCNFQLRGAASMEDEALVKQVCETQGIPFHYKRFDTIAYTQQKGLSIQMAARELRYDFFQQLSKKHGYDYIATAHHLNDTLETILLNLIKGTGIDGLVGIPVKKGNIIRPLLFANKEMLLNYAALHQIAWREDASNTSIDYQRNFIRHQVIPQLRQINPNLEKTFANTRERLSGVAALTRSYVHQFCEHAIICQGDQIRVDKSKLTQTAAPSVVLWELVKDKGFNFDQCASIVQEHQPGKKILSMHYELYADRTDYIIAPRRDAKMDAIFIETQMLSVKGSSGVLSFDVLQARDFVLNRQSDTAQLDFNKIQYPLVWRSWKPGDTFFPLGMSRSKKVSDFLIDQKVPMPEKSKVTVLESAGNIVWVVGLRIDDRFKVSDSTTQVLVIRFNTE